MMERGENQRLGLVDRFVNRQVEEAKPSDLDVISRRTVPLV
jgi:hypothetical protein